MICSALFTTPLVILSMFLLSCKASPPLTELGTVHTHPRVCTAMIFFSTKRDTLDRKILPLIIPKDVLMQVYVIISQFVGEFQRETLCIGNAVSHKCVLAFITKTNR